jgi:hypothetical protein
MIIRNKPNRSHGLDEPIRHENHARPVSRRDFIASGFLSGSAVVTAPAWLGMLLKSRAAHGAAIPQSADIRALEAASQCNISTLGGGKIPFICFDLAGGANLIGSEVLMGVQGGQMNFLSTAGYNKLGLPGNMLPTTATFVSTALGLAWHADGGILRGILSKAGPATQGGVNGAVIAARSENDTGNNPHNPMYGIARVGAKGQLLTLIGSQSSMSGGNSAAPMTMIDPALQPTKISQASDATALVDTGGTVADPDSVAILEAQARISAGTAAYDKTLADPTPAFSNSALGAVKVFPADAPSDAALKQSVRCAYVKSSNTAAVFGDPAALNPDLDTDIVGPAGIFTTAEYQADAEIRKTAAVMKLVVTGFAGAGTITMGGYDYHDGTRATGEMRNFRAGVCIGAVLEYAKRRNQPVMIYVFSDGSLSAMPTVDSSIDGRGKLAWQGDNQATASTFFLVYSPNGRPAPRSAASQQIGSFNPDGSINTGSSPAANAVNLLVETVILNYMALHGMESQFSTSSYFPSQGLGSPTARDAITAFSKIA